MLACGGWAGYPLVTMHASDFLDQVFFDSDIKTIAGRCHEKFFAFTLEHHAQTRQYLRDLIGIHATRPIRDARAQCAALPDCAAGNSPSTSVTASASSTANIQDQLGSTIQRHLRCSEIYSALKTIRRVGTETKLTRFTDNHAGSKKRTFQERCRWSHRLLRCLPHPSRQPSATGCLLSAITSISSCKFTRLFIQQFQTFTDTRETHLDIAIEFIQIKGMQGCPSSSNT